MPMGTTLLIVLAICLLATIASPKLKHWGYVPPGVLGLLLVLVLVLMITGHVPWTAWQLGPRS